MILKFILDKSSKCFTNMTIEDAKEMLSDDILSKVKEDDGRLIINVETLKELLGVVNYLYGIQIENGIIVSKFGEEFRLEIYDDYRE